MRVFGKNRFSLCRRFFSFSLIVNTYSRNRTTVQGLKEWMPEEIFQYCQEHKLLDRLVGTEGSGSSAVATGMVATRDYQPPYSAAKAPSPAAAAAP